MNQLFLPEMIRWTHGEGMALTLIETMPLGDGNWTDQHLPLSRVRANLLDQFTGHDVVINRCQNKPAVARHMSVTGG